MHEFRQQSHKNEKARIKSMGGTSGRATGGLTGHPDALADRHLVKRMVKKEALTGRADGGRAPAMPGKPSKKEGKGPHVMVNVIAPHGGQPGPGAPVGALPAGPSPMPSPRMAPPPMAPRPSIGGMPGAGAPGPLGAKHGGKIARAEGGRVRMTASAANGEGRLQKIAAYGAKSGVKKSK